MARTVGSMGKDLILAARFVGSAMKELCTDQIITRR